MSRPKLFEMGRSHSITLSDVEAARLKAIGWGNVSLGVRICLAKHEEREADPRDQLAVKAHAKALRLLTAGQQAARQQVKSAAREAAGFRTYEEDEQPTEAENERSRLFNAQWETDNPTE